MSGSGHKIFTHAHVSSPLKKVWGRGGGGGGGAGRIIVGEGL